MNYSNRGRKITIEELYPHFTPEQCARAEENITEYLKIVMEMYERIRNDPEEYARFKALTRKSDLPTIKE